MDTYTVKRDLTDLPDLPDETESADDFIGVDAVVSDEELDLDAKKEKLRGVKDEKGHGWDPMAHSFPPKMTKTGLWKKRRGVHKSTGPEATTNAEYRKSAEQMAHFYALLNYSILGEGAEPDKELMAQAIDGFEAYCQDKHVKDFPAWLQLMIGCTTYSAGVASKPKPAQKVKRWFNKFLQWIGLVAESDDDEVKKVVE